MYTELRLRTLAGSILKQGVIMSKYFKFIAGLVAVLALITGCGSDGENDNYVVFDAVEKQVTVNSDGSLDMTTASGITVKAEENTFSENINVKITEEERQTSLSSYFSNASPLFTISAEKVTATVYGDFTSKVTNVEKPVTIAIPNNIRKKGIYYLGVRANSSQDWNYSPVNDNNSYNTPLVLSSRFNIDYNTPEFYFQTYNVDCQFSVFLESEEHYKSTPRTVITGFVPEASPTEYELEDNHYKNDLSIKATIAGDRISNLSSDDYTVEIGFLNNDWSAYDYRTLPVTGANATYSVSKTGAGTGSQYKHTITLTNISDYSNNTLSFGLATSKVSPRVFPADFTVTVKVKGRLDVLAYENTKGISLTEKPQESKPETAYINVASVSPANGAVKVATDSASVITVRFDDELDTDTVWSDYVTVTNGSEKVSAAFEYKDMTLTISHTGLSEATAYTVTLKGGIKGKKEYSETVPYSFCFTTVKAGEKAQKEQPEPVIQEITYISLTGTLPANGSIDVATESTTAISISFDQELSSENDWPAFVSMTGSKGDTPYSVEYQNKTITVKHNGLLENSYYTVTIKAGLKGAEDNTEAPAVAYTFKTIRPATAYITAALTVPAQTTGIATSTPVEITFSDDIIWSDEDKELVTLSDGLSIVACAYSYEDRKLTLTPEHSLLFNKQYTVNISKYIKAAHEYTEMQGKQQLSFTTESYGITPEITGDTAEGLYRLVPGHTFTVDFKRQLTDTAVTAGHIYMLKNNVPFSNFTVDFDAGMQTATVTVNEAFESDAIYTVAVSEFADSRDNATINSVGKEFTAMSGIVITGIKIASGSEMITASGSTDVSREGNIRVTLSKPVNPDAVKLLKADGSEVTTGITGKTSENSDVIEFNYSAAYASTYGVQVVCSDETTGQELDSGIHTFATGLPFELELMDPAEPNGKDNPYLVCSAKALDTIRESEYVYSSYYFKQMADIDLATGTYTSPTNTSSEGWEPFPSNVEAQIGYNGYYDGNNKVIRNLSIYRPSDNFISLFGFMMGGYIKNLGLEDVNITGYNYLAPLISGAMSTLISNCYTTGIVINSIESEYEGYISGLVAAIIGASISNSHSTVTIISKSSFTGGLLGMAMMGVVSNSYYEGNISSIDYVGGIGGAMEAGTIRDCYAKGNITATGNNGYVGGLMGGIMGGSINNCYTEDITVTSNGSSVGGLLGFTEMTQINNSHSTGSVEGYENVGGLIGYCNSPVSNSYSECDVHGYNYVGGLIGGLDSDGSITDNCSASGNVTGEEEDPASRYVGDLIGYQDEGYD